MRLVWTSLTPGACIDVGIEEILHCSGKRLGCERFRQIGGRAGLFGGLPAGLVAACGEHDDRDSVCSAGMRLTNFSTSMPCMSGMFRSSTMSCTRATASCSMASRPVEASMNSEDSSPCREALTIFRMVGESSTMRILCIKRQHQSTHQN